MSSTIWTRCAGPSRVRRLAGRFFRVVESQFLNSTRKLVDSDEEQVALERLIDSAKAPVPAGFERLHYLLFTPFRHPPLRNGSRFGRRTQRGLLYGARALSTCFAEVAYYRFVFLEGTAADLGDVTTPLTAFRFGVQAARAVDLTSPPFAAYRAQLSSKTDYTASQALGDALRAAQVQACVYASARARDGGDAVAIFDEVFSPKNPLALQGFRCVANRARVELSSQELAGGERHAFAREEFLVRGRLPAPAV